MIDEVARGELAEKELDAFITRRALKMNPEQARVEELWEASARQHRAELRQERLHEQHAFHIAMLESHTRTFERLLRRHRTGLKLVELELGITTEEGDAA